MTKSEQAHPAPSVDYFENCMKILAEIPTDRAMKELSQTGAKIPAVRQAVETMALQKEILIKSLRLMRMREDVLQVSNRTDKIIGDLLKENGNDYEIVFK